MILHSALRNDNGRMLVKHLTHKRHPIARPCYGVSFMRILEKIDRVMMAPHCILDQIVVAHTCVYNTLLHTVLK